MLDVNEIEGGLVVSNIDQVAELLDGELSHREASEDELVYDNLDSGIGRD